MLPVSHFCALTKEKKSFQMHFFAKLWYLCDSHGLPSCKACLVAIQVSYWCADFSLSVPRLFGLSLFKNSHTWRQTKVLSSFCFLVKISIVFPSLTYWSSFGGWKGFTLCASYLSVHICVLDVSHRHCREVVGDVFVCLCVCVLLRRSRMTPWHVLRLTSICISLFSYYITV